MRVLTERGVVAKQETGLEFDLLPAARSILEYGDEVSLFETTGFPVCECPFEDFTRKALLGVVHEFDVGELKAERAEDWVMEEVNKALSHKKRIGRPLTIVDGYRVAELRAQGASWREIAGKLDIGAATPRRALSRLAKSLPKPSNEA